VEAEPPRVTVVIPNWNGRELLERIALPSLAQQTYQDFAVVVVDNGSTDDSCDYLAAEWPGASVIRLAENHGFAGGVNRGIAESESEYVAIVATDIELDKSWLAQLVASLDTHQDAGSATGKVLRYEDRQLIFSLGTTVKWSGAPDARGKGERDLGQHERARPVLAADGGASLFRRSALEAVGPFDEDFFAYNEDVDWGFRAQLGGYTCWYVPGASGYHVGGATSQKVAGLFTFLMIRNSWWFAVKNYPAPMLLKAFPMLSLALALRSYTAIRGGAVRPVLWAWLEAVVGTPRMVRKRRTIQKRRRVDSAYLGQLIGLRYRDAPAIARFSKR
jgi:GT2 family glycosyltransferase